MATKKAPPTTKPTPPDLDELFDRIKGEHSPEDRLALVKQLRKERLDWQKKQAKKQDAKEK